MRAFLLSLLLIWTTLVAREDVAKQISKTHSALKSFDKKYSNLHKKLEMTAAEIKEKERVLQEQQDHIARLSKELERSQEQYESDHKELQTFKEKQQLIQEKQTRIEKELIESLARNISIGMLGKDKSAVTTQSLITEEILRELNIQTQRNIEKLEQEHNENAKTIESYQTRATELQSAISRIDRQKGELLEVTRDNKNSIESMQSDKAKYKASIDKLLAQKEALKETLAQLNIIRSQEEKEKSERVRQETKSAHARVTKSGSSYQSVKSKKYRGAKTIAPLSDYKVVKGFGPYTDPIYNIKIYNESVTLQPGEQNAKVKTVLNGKVILAKNTPLLDNVVIIKHANGLHTIYAHLDMIAPNIEKGKRVKKGAVIGRIDDELIFEVTQDSFHIDPMTLIR